MASLQAEQIQDLLTSTLNDLGEGKWTDAMTMRQSTVFMDRLFNDKKIVFQTGPEAEWNLMTATNGSARGVGLFFTANVNPTNVLKKGKIDWRHFTYNFAVEDFEILANRSPAKLVDLLKTRQTAAMGDAVVYVEQRGWHYPTAANTTDFAGVPFWVVKSTTDAASDTTNKGFNGTLQSGYTTVGNITPSDIAPKWNNYADKYVTVTAADLVEKLWRAGDFTNFTPLVKNTPDYNSGNEFSYYTCYVLRNELKNIAKSQNDNLGFDMDPIGNPTFRRAPVEWVVELDDDTDEPIYGINWGVFKLAVFSGRWNKPIRIERHPNQPTTMAVHFINTCQPLCYDRRRNFVLAKGDSYDESLAAI